MTKNICIKLYLFYIKNSYFIDKIINYILFYFKSFKIMLINNEYNKFDFMKIKYFEFLYRVFEIEFKYGEVVIITGIYNIYILTRDEIMKSK